MFERAGMRNQSAASRLVGGIATSNEITEVEAEAVEAALKSLPHLK